MTVLMVPSDVQPWPSLGAQVCAFIEASLVFGPGDLRGQPARLDAEKRALIWRMYEVYPQTHALAGRRRFKRVGVSLAKGLAKTELAAWLAACELHPDGPVRCVGWDAHGQPIGGGVIDPYIPLVAYTEEQSDELAYGALKAILEEGLLAKDFDIGLGRIMRRRGDGKAESLALAPSARDGARTTFSVADETHWWTLPRQKQAHQTMLANLPKRKAADAWMLEVTTAPEPGAGSVAEATMDYARAVESGQVQDSRLFYFHREASDTHDLETPAGARAAVIEASGAAAAWRDIDNIVALRQDPRMDAAYWERVWCNRLVKSQQRAFDTERWNALATPHNPVQLGDLITLGFDGAISEDATGLVATHVATGYQWVAGVWEKPYGREDWQIDTTEVDEAVAGMFSSYDVWRMYADPAYWQLPLAMWAGMYGAERVVAWATNRRDKAMTMALELFSTAIAQGTLSHGGEYLFSQHIGNAHKRETAIRDEQGRRMWIIQKERHDSPHKIDLAMAAVLSWQARTDALALGVLHTAGATSFGFMDMSDAEGWPDGA